MNIDIHRHTSTYIDIFFKNDANTRHL